MNNHKDRAVVLTDAESALVSTCNQYGMHKRESRISTVDTLLTYTSWDMFTRGGTIR